jgi:hypothetical protein
MLPSIFPLQKTAKAILAGRLFKRNISSPSVDRACLQALMAVLDDRRGHFKDHHWRYLRALASLSTSRRCRGAHRRVPPA